MKRAFYNSSAPERTMLEQFRIMVKKQSFKKKEWVGKKPRVVNISLPDNSDNLFNNFGLTKDQFLDFIGQASTFAFSYKLESPILPFMMNAALTSTTISRFDFATKLYNKIDVKLPQADFEIKIFHQGWEFAEESYQENAKSLLKINLGMAIEIEIFDTFNEKVIYNQFFFAEKTYIENKNKVMICDAAVVCELTEAILERAFLSIRDKNYRKKLIQGDSVQSKFSSAIFQLDTDKPEEVEKQFEFVLKELPQVDSL